MSDALYLVDGSGFIFRAYHALPPLTTKAGTPTGAVYGFAQMIIKLEQDYRPSHLAVVFDASGRSFRDDLYPAYKAHRPPTPDDLIPQFGLVRRVTEAFGVPQIELPGFEADDIIATLTRAAQARGLRVVIVSSDKDLMQLVADDVVMLETMKNVTYDARAVEEKFGVPPARLGDVLALMGDSVDNVPGVPGIGPKTAAILIRHFGSLDEVISRVEEVGKVPGLRGAEGVMNKLKAHLDSARLSRRLVALDEQVGLPIGLDDLRRPEPDMGKVESVLRELELARLIERMRPATATVCLPLPLAGEGRGEGATATAATATATIGAAEVILSLDDLKGRAATLASRPAVGLVLEVVGTGPWAPLVSITLATDGVPPIYIPVGHRYLGAPAQIAADAALAVLAPLLGDAAVRKYIHSHKAAHRALGRYGIPLAGVAGDPELCAYLIDPSQPTDLTSLAASAGAVVEERTALCGTGKKEVAFDTLEVAHAAAWAGRRAEASLTLGQLLGAEVSRRGLGKLLDEVELPLGRVLAVIERHGVRLDAAWLLRLSRETEQRLIAIQEEVQAQAGYEVNLASPKQLQELLFDRLKLTPTKKTKTGFSVDAEVLEELAGENPIAAKIHEHRSLSKLKGTYIDALPHLVDPHSGRLHTSYNQIGAATGRISSVDPNLQNIPIRSELGREIRRAFVADPGCLLVAADYSQIELRVVAHLSHDPLLTDSFLRGQDVHQRTACEMFLVAQGAVTPEMRRIAKAINFGIIYGQTDYGLARAVGIKREEAKRYIADYFTRYAGVARFMDELVAVAHRDAGARTLLGRFRPLPDLAAQNRTLRMQAERIARNTPIQGTAADLIKLAMIAVQERLEREFPEAKMLLTVHDELVLEAKEADAERVGRMTAEVMEQVWKMDVPLKVDVGVGKNWAEC
ncbi:MAG: DNA polymerase I [Myxococcales bacterium]|nr:DNA polymerase I [Myxococcales bacterium]